MEVSAELIFWMVVLHFLGDYVTQSDWMACEKVKRWLPALAHAVTYGLPFLLITLSPWALLVIIGTHAVIDRYRLARYVVWAKNLVAPKAYRTPPWRECTKTGYPADRDSWLVFWLMIIADNLIHILINFLAVKYL
jgi:hypothetical protein